MVEVRGGINCCSCHRKLDIAERKSSARHVVPLEMAVGAGCQPERQWLPVHMLMNVLVVDFNCV